MEFIILLIMVMIIYFILRIIFDFNIKKLKEIGINEELDKLTSKYPNNLQICKDYLDILNNKDVKIEEDKNSNATLYLIASNKIFISDLKNSYTRIQTIAHECLHSIQSKKILWFNFIFSNIYLIFFIVISILGILKILKYKMLYMSILILLGLTFYSVRVYLENDAMIKARFLAESYMKNKKISNENEIRKIVSQYDKLNDIAIKAVNFKLYSNVLSKIIILSIIFMIF